MDRGAGAARARRAGAGVRPIRAHRIKYRFYDTFDGLAGASVGIIGSSRGGDGTLWFVRGGGVTVVANTPALDDDRADAPLSLRIEDVVANDRPHRLDVAHALSGGHDPGPESATPRCRSRRSDRIRFRYRLDGIDTEWVDAGTRRTAFYTNLSPGSYRFQVDASGEDGSWQTAPVAWSFSVEPAFYQTPLVLGAGRGGRRCWWSGARGASGCAWSGSSSRWRSPNARG